MIDFLSFIPNLSILRCLEPSGKFVVVAGWWVLVETNFSVKLESQAEQYFIPDLNHGQRSQDDEGTVNDGVISEMNDTIDYRSLSL